MLTLPLASADALQHISRRAETLFAQRDQKATAWLRLEAGIEKYFSGENSRDSCEILSRHLGSFA